MTVECRYRTYDSSKGEVDLETVQRLISADLSEPYSIYVYRYFVYEWPDLCFLVSIEWTKGEGIDQC